MHLYINTRIMAMMMLSGAIMSPAIMFHKKTTGQLDNQSNTD